MIDLTDDKVRLVCLAVFALACSGPSDEVSCERVADTARAIHPGAYTLTLEHCKANHWSESTRACAVAAKTRTEFTACAGAHLVIEAPPEPPRPRASPPSDDQGIVLNLHTDGTLFIDGQPLSSDGLNKLFADAASRTPQTRVVLRAENATPATRVENIVRRAKAAGLAQLSFATVGEQAVHDLRFTTP
jgi:biopolymer transport protein ExbD